MEVVYDDKIRVCAQRIDPNYETITKDGKEFKTKNCNPYAELNISVPGEPKFDIQVETKKDIYDSKYLADGKIDVSIIAKNNGDAEAKNIVLTIDTAGLELLRGKNEYKITELHKDEALKPINLTLKTPAPWEDTDFNITARITYLDIKDKKYKYEGSKKIKVEKKWDLIVSKVFPKDRHMGETVPISVTVRNTGLCDLNNIVLSDSIVSGMYLKENKTLNKTLSLKSGEKAEKILEYSIIPEKPGEFTFPQCVATFTLPNGQRKEVSSNNSGAVKISGPDITVTKTVDKQQLSIGDSLNVTVTALNTGDVSANIKMNDTLPPGTKLLGGKTSSRQILKSGGGSMSINYTLQMDTEGEVKLPACKANFYDLSKNSGEVSSDTPVVYVGTRIYLEGNNSTKVEGKNISLEGNNTKIEGKDESNQGENNSSVPGQIDGVTNENDGITPGFDLIPSLIGFLAVTGLLIKRRV
jgi:uncharacterized repeat protein (TIGR01451 family)